MYKKKNKINQLEANDLRIKQILSVENILIILKEFSTLKTEMMDEKQFNPINKQLIQNTNIGENKGICENENRCLTNNYVIRPTPMLNNAIEVE